MHHAGQTSIGSTKAKAENNFLAASSPVSSLEFDEP